MGLVVCQTSQPSPCPYHLLWSGLDLLVLASDERRACHDRGAGGHGGAEGSPGEGTEEAGVHAGLSAVCGSACGFGGPIGGMAGRTGKLTHWTTVREPGEMSGDGDAGAERVRGVEAAVGKSSKLHAGKIRVTWTRMLGSPPSSLHLSDCTSPLPKGTRVFDVSCDYIPQQSKAFVVHLNALGPSSQSRLISHFVSGSPTWVLPLPRNGIVTRASC